MSETDDVTFIRRAIRLSEQALKNGNHPFGALLVKDGKVIVEAESTKINTKDCTRHAELTVASLGSMILSMEELSECTLYTSTEPCVMCSGAIYWSGISRVVYACSNDTLGKLASGGLRLGSREVFASGKRHVEVVGPILEEEAVRIHRRYWKQSAQLSG